MTETYNAYHDKGFEIVGDQHHSALRFRPSRHAFTLRPTSQALTRVTVAQRCVSHLSRCNASIGTIPGHYADGRPEGHLVVPNPAAESGASSKRTFRRTSFSLAMQPGTDSTMRLSFESVVRLN